MRYHGNKIYQEEWMIEQMNGQPKNITPLPSVSGGKCIKIKQTHQVCTQPPKKNLNYDTKVLIACRYVARQATVVLIKHVWI